MSQNSCCGDDCSALDRRLWKTGTYVCAAIANGGAYFARHQTCLIAVYARANHHTYAFSYAIADRHTHVYRNASADGNANCYARAHAHDLATVQRFREYCHRVR